MSITVLNPLILAILQGNDAAPDDGLFTAENVSGLRDYSETSRTNLSLLNFHLGSAYENELGVDRDLARAKLFYAESLNYGHVNAKGCIIRVDGKIANLVKSKLLVASRIANRTAPTSVAVTKTSSLNANDHALSGNASPPGDSPTKASVDSSSTSQPSSSKPLYSYSDILRSNSNPLKILHDKYIQQKSLSENAAIAMNEAIVALVLVQASFEKAKDLVSKRTATFHLFSANAELASKSYHDAVKNQQIKMEKEKLARLDQQIGNKKKMAMEARARSDKASRALALLTTQTASLNKEAEMFEISFQSFIASIPSSLKAVALQEPSVKPGQVHIQEHVQDHVPAHILVRSPFQNPNHIPIPAHGLVLPEKRFWVYKENLDAIVSYWRSKGCFPRLPARGLHNAGNTCFINATLQCLAASIHFTSTFYSSGSSFSGSFSFGRHGSTCKVPSEQFCVNRSVEDFIGLKMFDSRAIVPATPDALVKNVKTINSHFVKGREEDAHEFLISLFQLMIAGFLDAHGVKEGSPDRLDETTAIHSVFGGYLLSHVQCLSCNTYSENFESFLDLSLPLGINIKSVHDALKDYTTKEVNFDWCPSKTHVHCATKQLSIFSTPRSFVLHLKRFTTDPSSGKTEKNQKHFEFFETLDATSFISDASAEKKQPVLFELYGVLVHSGQTANSGHYVAFVKSLSTGQWYEMNDEEAKEVTWNVVKQQQAFILFYSKQDTSFQAVSSASIAKNTSSASNNSALNSAIPSSSSLADSVTQTGWFTVVKKSSKRKK